MTLARVLDRLDPSMRRRPIEDRRAPETPPRRWSAPFDAHRFAARDSSRDIDLDDDFSGPRDPRSTKKKRACVRFHRVAAQAVSPSPKTRRRARRLDRLTRARRRDSCAADCDSRTIARARSGKVVFRRRNPDASSATVGDDFPGGSTIAGGETTRATRRKVADRSRRAPRRATTTHVCRRFTEGGSAIVPPRSRWRRLRNARETTRRALDT